MRDFKNMKRQRGRNRGGQGQGGGKPQQNANRAFESNGPDGIKVRGHAQSVYEKYQQLARDAFSAGDRVLAENYLQHAEHYFRVVRTLQPNRPPADIVGRDIFTNGYDIDFEDESLEGAAVETPAEADAPEAGAEGSSEARDGRRDRDDFRRDERPREENRRDREDRGEFRRDRDRDERGDVRRDRDRNETGDFRRDREDRPRDDRGEGRRDYGRRDERPRDDRPREDRPREEGQDRFREGRRDRYDRDRRDDKGERRDRFDRERGDRFEPRPDVAATADEPVRQPAEVIEPVRAAPAAADYADDGVALRSEDGGYSPAPAFLQSASPGPAPAFEPEEREEPRPRTRRRRAPRSFEGGEDAGAPETAAPASEEA